MTVHTLIGDICYEDNLNKQIEFVCDQARRGIIIPRDIPPDKIVHIIKEGARFPQAWQPARTRELAVTTTWPRRSVR